jgi:protein SCO1/2
LPIGSYELIDQSGAPFGSAELRGKVAIVDFVFTSCPDVCPVLTTQMANLHRRIRDDDVRFVSISVDPEHDTPEVLRSYAARFRADTARWKFLTGPSAPAVVQDHFRVAIGDRSPRADGSYTLLHGSRFLLVDRRGTLRGIYGTDREELDRLEHDVARLREEG